MSETLALRRRAQIIFFLLSSVLALLAKPSLAQAAQVDASADNTCCQ